MALQLPAYRQFVESTLGMGQNVNTSSLSMSAPFNILEILVYRMVKSISSNKLTEKAIPVRMLLK